MSRRARGGRATGRIRWVHWRVDRTCVAWRGPMRYGGMVRAWNGLWTATLFDDTRRDGFRHRYQAKRWVECELARAECEARNRLIQQTQPRLSFTVDLNAHGVAEAFEAITHAAKRCAQSLTRLEATFLGPSVKPATWSGCNQERSRS